MKVLQSKVVVNYVHIFRVLCDGTHLKIPFLNMSYYLVLKEEVPFALNFTLTIGYLNMTSTLY